MAAKLAAMPTMMRRKELAGLTRLHVTNFPRQEQGNDGGAGPARGGGGSFPTVFSSSAQASAQAPQNSRRRWSTPRTCAQVDASEPDGGEGAQKEREKEREQEKEREGPTPPRETSLPVIQTLPLQMPPVVQTPPLQTPMPVMQTLLRETPPLSLETPLAVDTSAWPRWMLEEYGLLNAEMGAEWQKVVRLWAELEQAYGFPAEAVV
ncbi:hypothetical protein B0H17DRAFT_1215415 [Mycena rosella]|uniref:Uncharacterized protein n=1 Tax=Mycena rosella TaxID=1033263 RepID=A0AAD7G0A4_MYCRO|nr:hypothetical protein B0H17DRAFT_1215415 [Mycena rosella]